MKTYQTTVKKVAPAAKRHPTAGMSQLQRLANSSPKTQDLRQLQRMADSGVGPSHAHTTPNRTGLPDTLKSGIENLSGVSMDHVKVHRNSTKPAQLQAHAYAQGSDIHLGPGQEKHLPHEAWHVVQQTQGRVKPTIQLRGIGVNDDAGLEQEADVMGAKAAQFSGGHFERKTPHVSTVTNLQMTTILQRNAIIRNRLNVVGEDHVESDDRREDEMDYIATRGINRNNYWTEDGFVYDIKEKKKWLGGLWTTTKSRTTHRGDPRLSRVEGRLAYIKEKVARRMAWLSGLQGLRLNKAEEYYTGMEWRVAMERLNYGVNMAIDDLGQLTRDPEHQNIHGTMQTILGHMRQLRGIFLPLEGVNVPTSRPRIGYAQMFMQHWTPVEPAFVQAIGRPIQLFATTVFDRSQGMHDGAEHAARKRGVWKVGQTHVDQIKGQIDANEAGDYNIVTQNEFNTELYAARPDLDPN